MRLLSAPLLLTLGVLASTCRLDPIVIFCSEDSRCDDGNPCTVDTCDEKGDRCVFEARANGADCGDDNVCNGIEICDENALCQQGEPIVITDGDPCTEDRCDPVSGMVTHPPIDGCNVNTAGWQLLASEGAPSPRERHAAVWTGSQMLVWGGKVSGVPSVAGDGARYDPASDSWTAMSNVGAPAARHSHSAVWTGTHMLVWGGFGESSFLQDGARYDPTTDSWSPMNGAGAPLGRTLQRTVWTDSEMVVWGGLNGATPLNDGGRYNAAQDQWSSIANAGAPSSRFSHHMVWTGTQVVVWGGTDTFDWLKTGAYYDPATNTWNGPTSDNGAPFMRESGAGILTRAGFLIWGGWDGGNYLPDGATLTLGGDWTIVSAQTAPTARAKHAFVWTGSQVFLWGGCGGEVCEQYRENGALYTPDAGGGVWSPFVSDPRFAGRADHTMVWTGSEAIVFGGRNGSGILGDGARSTLQR